MTMAALMQSRPWSVAGWTMLHFLWVGGVLGLAAAATRRTLRRAGPETRYGFALASLMALALAPVAISWLVISTTLPGFAWGKAPGGAVEPFSDPPVVQPDRFPAQPAPGPGPDPDRPGVVRPGGGATLGRFLAAAAEGLPWLWLAGAPATFGLLAAGLIGAERLRRQSRPLTEGPPVDLCRCWADALRITRPVALAVCDRLAMPLVLGVFRPMILLPPAALTGWSPELLEMALLHELAHVRRHDILVNLLQRVVESILFFHPVIWVASGWVRQEREHCCDRIVVARTGRPVAYATALFSLLSPAPASRATALAMARNHLVVRIRHILDPEDLSLSLPRTTVGLIAALVLIPVLLLGSQVASPRSRDPKPPEAAAAREQTVPAPVRIPGRIIAEVSQLGEPAIREPTAGVTGIIEINPETGEWRRIVEKRGPGRVSPDGQSLVFLRHEKKGDDPEIWVAAVRGGDPPAKIADLLGVPLWSPDGKQIVVSASKGRGKPGLGFETWRIDAGGASRTRLPIPETDQVLDWSASDRLLVRRTEEGKSSLRIVRSDGTDAGPMSISGMDPRFSPDGREIVYVSRTAAGGTEVTLSDTAGGNLRQIHFGDRVAARRACWSPDGRWLAVSLMDLQERDGRLVLTADLTQLNCRLEIMDPEGKQRRPLALPPGYVMLEDWR